MPVSAVAWTPLRVLPRPVQQLVLLRLQLREERGYQDEIYLFRQLPAREEFPASLVVAVAAVANVAEEGAAQVVHRGDAARNRRHGRQQTG